MLSVDGLQGPGRHQPVFGPLSFHIDAGECLALTGPSGAGKSLLLRSIADLDPNIGEVRAGTVARDATPAPDWRRLVAYVPANAGWRADLVGAHFSDLPAATDLLRTLGFEAPDAVMSWPVSHLSSGEQSRLALVRALLGHASVLLLDEPTAALDPDSCVLVETLLRARLDAGVAILLVSHDPAEVDRLARRSLHMRGGQLVQGP